uniref:Uncharacterized protein n=1 Tax=Medicago truncatula TaxID=3880 RepID=A2Q4M5_MEDTR|nr:hypothetical protein MtrDRAFT_AC157506g6v2 [Medicago truncatula]
MIYSSTFWDDFQKHIKRIVISQTQTPRFKPRITKALKLNPNWNEFEKKRKESQQKLD